MGMGREGVDKKDQTVNLSIGNHGSDLLVPTQRPAFDQVNIKLRTDRHDLRTGRTSRRDAAKLEFIKVCFCP